MEEANRTQVDERVKVSGLVGVDGKPLNSNKDEIKFLGLRITPVGEMQVWLKDGASYTVEPEDVPLFSTLKIPSKETLDAMSILFACIGEVLKMPKRAIPVTRKELIKNGVSKLIIKKLARIGLVRNISITTSEIVNGKPVAGPSVNVVYPTPQGKAFFKEHFHENTQTARTDNPNNVGALHTNTPKSINNSTSSRGGELSNEALPENNSGGPEETDQIPK